MSNYTAHARRFKNRLVIWVFILFAASACVPAKKLVPLQYGDELKHRNEIIPDSVYRTRYMKIREYRIQPLDILNIRFESLTDQEFDFFARSTNGNSGNNSNQAVNNGILVDGDGDVEFPVIGHVHLAGLTVFEAQDTLKNIASNYLRNVVVRVRVLNFRFSVLGEVGSDKVITTGNTQITMMEAVGLAGGFSEMADRKNIKVVRQKEGKSEIYYINILKEDFIESDFYYVQQNDIIIVPPLKQRTFRKYFTTNLGIWTSALSATLLIISLLTR